MMPKRQQHAPEFKAKVALEARKGKATVSELASRSGVCPTMINEMKRPLLDVVCGIFKRGSRWALVIDEHQVRDLQARIGELVVTNSLLERKPGDGKRSVAGLNAIIPTFRLANSACCCLYCG